MTEMIDQTVSSTLGPDDPEMSAISMQMLKFVTPKCMCKSKRGRKMNVILEFRYPNQHNNCFSPLKVYFRQFASTGAWIEMNKILGWQCPNCHERKEHSRIALISRGGDDAVPEVKTNEGLVVNRGRVEEMWYEHIGLVPYQLKHLIPDEWWERAKSRDYREDGGGYLLPMPLEEE